MKKIILTLTAIWSVSVLWAQGDVYEKSDEYEWPDDTEVVRKLKDWQDLKLGVLIHWGLYAVPGIVESWSICDENWITRDTTMTYQQYKDWYWGFAEKFNPTNFNPKQWARGMKDAGMRYMIFTTKHHDGFCMYDSRYTDFSIARHAFKNHPERDVLRYVLNAFQEEQFMLGTYFSKPDWHSQYYWWDVYPTKGRNVNYPISTYPWRWKQFQQFTYNQIDEILSNYGTVDILWLDGGWVCTENKQDINMPAIADMARKHQPGILIVDRTCHGPYENYQTPERTIQETQLAYPWESCIPLSDDWGYVNHPKWKSPEKVINTLIEIVAKGGNLVLGVGPTPDGIIQSEAVERLEQIGEWMKRNGKAIYNTVPTKIYHDGNVWFTSSKDKRKCYAIYMLEEGAGIPETISWRGNLPKKGTKLRLVEDNSTLRWKIHGDSVTVKLPSKLKAQSFAIEIASPIHELGI